MFPEEFHDPFNHQTPARGSRQGVRGQRTSVLSFGVPKDKEFVICLFYFHICKAAGPDLIPFLCNCSHWVTWALGVVLESHHSPTQGWGPVLDQFSFSFNSHIVWTQWVKSPWNFLLSAGILHEICIHFFSYSFFIFILFPIFLAFFSQDIIQFLSVRWTVMSPLHQNFHIYCENKPKTSSVQSSWVIHLPKTKSGSEELGKSNSLLDGHGALIMTLK